jgi:hypothetical protein
MLCGNLSILRPAQSREVRDVINWLDENGQQQAYGRERRSAGPVYKR